MTATVPISIRSLVTETADPRVAGLRVFGRNRLILFEECLRTRVWERGGPREREWLDVGRVRQRAIQIRHPTVSRKHCRIRRTAAEEWEILDRDSTNGVFVAEQGRYGRFHEVKSATLRMGMIIRLGAVWLAPVNAAGDCPLAVICIAELARMGPTLYGSANEAQKHLGKSRQTITRMLTEMKRTLRAA